MRYLFILTLVILALSCKEECKECVIIGENLDRPELRANRSVPQMICDGDERRQFIENNTATIIDPQSGDTFTSSVVCE